MNIQPVIAQSMIFLVSTVTMTMLWWLWDETRATRRRNRAIRKARRNFPRS